MNVSTKEASYTLHAEVVGEHNVSAIASNANGTDMQTWMWNVTAAPVLNCTCGDICVNITGWWRDGGAFNASNTPIQHAIDNATACDTICVKDGTYNENVDVTKSHLTIRSENGPSVTTVSASLNPNKHVFDISDQTHVTLKGFEIRDAHGSQDVAGIYMYNASECKISGNIVTNISATGAYTAYGVWLSASDNNIFKSISMPGGISSGDAACGLCLESSNNNSFTDTTISNVAGDIIAAGIGLSSSNNNTFDPTIIEDIGGISALGVVFMLSNDTSFTDTTIKNVTGILATGISFGTLDPAGGDPIPGFSNYNTFIGTTIKNVAGFLMAEGIFLFASNNNTFDPTVIENVGVIEDQSGAFGIFLLASNDTSFTDTVIANVGGIGDQSVASGVFLFATNDTSFTDTTISNVAGFLATGISFGTLDPAGGAPIPFFPVFSNYNTFTDTTIRNVKGNMTAGISLIASNSNTFDPTVIENVEGIGDQSVASGVFLFATNDTSFTDTTIRNVKGNMTAGISLIASTSNTFDPTEIENVNGIYTAAGVYLDFANNNVFSETKVHEVLSSLQPENSFGFYLMESSSNKVTDGEIFNCARGTRIDSGRYNTIERNIIRDNFDTGVLLDRDAVYTEIHTNCFYNNIPQAMDNGANNSWTGNYWSPPPGGPGDYTIPGSAGSKDNEPLDECPLGEGLPPKITSFAPPSPVNDTVCTWRTFNVSVNQTVNVTWYLNGTAQVPKNVSVTEANFTFHAQYVGVHNVSAVTENANGMDMQTWAWNVTAAPAAAPNITSFAPPSPVNDTVCTWRTFNVTVNQTVNVSWYLNGSHLFTNDSVTEANYTLHAQFVGDNNVSAVASNANGTDMQTWIWNVTAGPAPAPPNITSFAPPSPVNDTVCNWRTFNVTVNQTVNVSWYLNNTLQHTNVSTKEANYTLHAEVVGEHNVSAIASNENGTDMQTWVWNVTAAPLPVLEINKTDNPDPVSPGGILNYSIRVNNTGNATATNVIVTETYDENVTFLDAVPAPSQGSGTWVFATLNVGEMKWINISVTVNASVLNETVLHNIVNVTCDEGVSDSDTEDTTVISLPVCIETATGTGIACFETDAGTIEGLEAVDESTLPEEGKPALAFPHGFFSFDITGLTPGQTVEVTVTLPDNVPVGTQYWKYHASEGGWIQIPMGSDDGDEIITITLVDGGLGDDDGTANGVIVDQGGPGMSLGIRVTKVADPPDVAPSSNVEFTITVSNTGDCTLDPVRVVDTLLGWMSYVSSSPAADTHDGTIIWNNVGPLDPGASKTITLVARIASDASGSVTNAVMVTGTNLTTGVNVTDSDTVTVTVLAKTIEPSTKTLIDVTTEIKSDRIVIEGEQFGWEAGNGNLLNNPPLSPGEAVGGIKYGDKMIGSNGTTEFTKNFGVNTNVTPNLAVTKDIGYTSGDLGSLSYAEQVSMRYSGASPPLSSTTKCEDVNAYSKMVVTDVDAATETEVGITETDERDLHYGIDAEGKGSVSAGVDASTSSMSYKDKSTAYGGNFSLHKKVDYTSKPSTSITTDLKGDSTVVEEGQFRGESGNKNIKYDDKMIGSNGTTEFAKCVDASTTNLEVDKSIGYKSGDLGSLSYDEQVGMRYSSNTKCEDVNAYGKMVATNATTETEVEITRRSLYYGIDAEGNGTVSAGAEAFVEDGRNADAPASRMTYEDKSEAYGNFTFSKEVGYTSNPP